MIQNTYDVIIVGTGCAGLFAALSLPSDKKVLLVTKDQAENSDSYLAQGGICVLKTKEDFDAYFEDTMRAGHYENSKEAVRIMIEESQDIIQSLIEYGVDFDKDESGALNYTKEAAHSTNRILHHKDVTGKEITEKLLAQVRKRENIELVEYVSMIDFVERDNCCYGIVTEDNNGKRNIFYAYATVLATGGIGGLFKHSTNFRHIAGDSFALAIRHGVELENLHYIQIHPTTLYSNKEGRRFLISESVRGEGAILLNSKGERFVDELLPRDVVTNTIYDEMVKEGTDHVYITMPCKSREEIAARFPNIFKACLEEGYDLSVDRVPVTPAQHYLMGGIKASVNGETSMRQLFAVGETANNGVHGANRLASNSLLESLVFARRAAKKISEELASYEYQELPVDLDSYEPRPIRGKENHKLLRDEIRRKDAELYVKWCNNDN